LTKFPGPKLWAASNIPFTWVQCTGNQAQSLLALHEKYGKVVRVAPKELSYVSAEAWRDILSHRQGHDEFAKVNPVPLPNGICGILQAHRADHSRFRRLLSHSFSEKGMREQQPTLQYYADLLIDGLKKNAEKGSQDMTQWFNWTTFDIIGKLAFGSSFGCLEHWQTHPWIETIFNNVRAIMTVKALKRLKMESLSPLIIPSKTQRLQIFNYKYSSDKIEERMKLGTERGDFWDNVLKHSTKGDGETGMTVEEMKSNASNIVLAGSETTATLLSGCIYQLLRNPSTMAKITSEIRSAFSSSDEIDLFNVSKLKYTLAVLNETMRIYPAVPSQAARVVPKGGDTVEGKFLPEGTIINLSQYAANHFSSNFAKPFEFHPERFLGAEEFKNDDFGALQPFSIGPRNCIGRNLAYSEMRLILAKTLYNVDLELDEKTGNWTELQRSYALWEKPPLWVHFKPVNTMQKTM
jgi:averantin hydroxylase